MSRIFGYAGSSQFRSDDEKYESTPLVVGEVIFITAPPATVFALDAKTGKEIWTYVRQVRDDVPVCCGRVNRGPAQILGEYALFWQFGWIFGGD